MQPRQIELRIKRIKRELTKLGPMRPGTLSMQYAACQKPGCACMDPVKPKKHGPFYQLSYSHLGKSTTRFVRPSYTGQIKKELTAYKRFRALTQEWVTQELAPSQLRLELARRKDRRKVASRTVLSSLDLMNMFLQFYFSAIVPMPHIGVSLGQHAAPVMRTLAFLSAPPFPPAVLICAYPDSESERLWQIFT